MKSIKNIINVFLFFLLLSGCEENRDIDFIENVPVPTNIAATFQVTQDNTGTVTITPTADGATYFDVDYGDNSDVVKLTNGESVQKVYAEGSYDLKVTAYNVVGESSQETIPLVVSFKAPTNVVATIENDAAISRKVNFTVTADFAITYDVYSGEAGVTDPVASGNVGETLSYTYAAPGDYDVRIVIKGAAIQTTEYTETFTVTEILQPVASATTPPVRNDSDVISIYGSEYTNVAGTDTFPDWGQGGQGSSWGAFTLNGDDMLQYTNLSYQGIQIGSAQDVSGMEYIHLDVWTADMTQLETSLISFSNGEKPVVTDLTADQWNSIDIPISEFTDQGLTVADIHQLKFVGTPYASATVFIDNIYFWKSPSSVVTSPVENFEGTAPGLGAFGNASAQVVTNPDQSGENTTSKVVELTKTVGAEVWAGASFDVSTPLDITNFKKLSIKTWSPKVGATVRFKIENSNDNTQFAEVDATTTVANGWETLTYNFGAAQDFNYDRLVIFFDFGVAGDGSVYYYDEINLFDDSGTIQPLVFQDFEGTAPTFTAFGNGGAGTVANPDASGINTSANVGEFNKPAGAEVWAGAYFDPTTPLDLDTYSKISIKSWSPKVGATIRLKLENSQDNTQFVEVDATTTVGSAWETLTFDLSAAPDFNYDRVVLFFDFGVAGDDTKYYFDDYTLN